MRFDSWDRACQRETLAADCAICSFRGGDWAHGVEQRCMSRRRRGRRPEARAVGRGPRGASLILDTSRITRRE